MYALDISAEMLNSFIMELNANKIIPKTITVADKRTEALLSDICSRCDVELTVKKSRFGRNGQGFNRQYALSVYKNDCGGSTFKKTWF